MTTLRERMQQDMTLLGLASSTQDIYLKKVTQLQKHYNKSPAKLSDEEIRNYLLYLKKRI